MGSTSDIRSSLVERFERSTGQLAGARLGWLDALRQEARTRFDQIGVPGVRDEDWKYTNIAPALRELPGPVLAGEVDFASRAARALVEGLPGLAEPAPAIVFVDGHFAPGLSRLDASVRGVSISSLRELLGRDPDRLQGRLGKFLPSAAHGLIALNSAFLDDGAVVEISAGATCNQPIHLVFVSTRREEPFVSQPRNVIVAGDGSSALVVEHYLGEEGARVLTNTVTEIELGRSAAFGHVRLQREPAGAFHVARVQIEQGEGSALTSHAFGFGAALSRTELAVRLGGENAECTLHGLYAVHGKQHVDHHTMVDHAAPRTRSNQLYKGVLDDDSRGVFTGRVLVRALAQKIKAMQTNPVLLLGDGAIAETRPQLEIYADDVACNHGASIGRINEEAMFYLRSRGIDPREARRLMVYGFAAEVVESLVPEALRESIGALVASHVGTLGARGLLA
ncbi:MAG: Fe-S cluster assembly protein SufD [Deltaproteobacteria bacterium]|nr:Fe-S cluster assembly protein SufD [Deltaproteobacteria bacterium]